MIKKYLVFIVLFQFLILIAGFGIKETQFIRFLNEKEAILDTFESRYLPLWNFEFMAPSAGALTTFTETIEIVGSTPILTMHSVKKEYTYSVSMEDKFVLQKIVQAEAGNEDMMGKILVANVILNRLRDDSFPDTIKEVVFQKENGVTQFSPVSNGAYDKAKPDEETCEAVERALAGEDYSNGALFFAAPKYADTNRMQWFETQLEKVVSHGGHEFFL